MIRDLSTPEQAAATEKRLVVQLCEVVTEKDNKLFEYRRLLVQALYRLAARYLHAAC